MAPVVDSKSLYGDSVYYVQNSYQNNNFSDDRSLYQGHPLHTENNLQVNN